MAESPSSPGSAVGTPLPAAPRPTFARRSLRLLLRTAVLVFVSLVVVAGLWLFAALQFSYSKGERAGHVQKLSSRGWICKTWEGELLLTTLPGVVPEEFAFTVRDESVARTMQTFVGQRVVLKYEQHKGVPACFGDTEYFITDVRRLDP